MRALSWSGESRSTSTEVLSCCPEDDGAAREGHCRFCRRTGCNTEETKDTKAYGGGFNAEDAEGKERGRGVGRMEAADSAAEWNLTLGPSPCAEREAAK